MPAYDYRCKECGKVVTYQMSFKEKDEFSGRCPECGGELERVFSPTSFKIVCTSCSLGE